MSVYRDDLQTEVVSLRYDFTTRTGYLHIAAGCCTDMVGCLALFESIDRKVQRIMTIAGDRPDTSYHQLDGAWVAQSPSSLEHKANAADQLA